MARTKVKTEHQLLPLVEHLARVGRRAVEASDFPGGLRPRHLIALGLLGQQGRALAGNQSVTHILFVVNA